VTVHDLSFLRLPQKFPRAKRLYLTRLCQASVNRARHVIAVSRQTADDLVRFFGTAAARITVIHNGVDRAFSPDNPADIEAFRAGRGLPSRYFLYVGTLEPRKNLPTLIRAFAHWRASGDPEAHQVKLVLAGAQGWFYAEIFRLVSELGLQDRVLFPGFVPDAELPQWYRAAEAFVYPSLFEGFGLPVLEAMACGTPVLCSRIGSLTEIVGEAALTVPPMAETEWMAAMALLARQPQLRQELGRRGLAQAQRFSWEATALATLEVYQAVHGH
jgi:glycosyltransferase involved in cell wall biosynthesis